MRKGDVRHIVVRDTAVERRTAVIMAEGIVAQPVGVGQIQQIGRRIRVLELDVVVEVAFFIEHRTEVILFVVVELSLGIDIPLLMQDPVKSLMLTVYGMLDDVFIIRVGEYRFVQYRDIHHFFGDQMPYAEQQDEEQDDNGSHDVVPFESFDIELDL